MRTLSRVVKTAVSSVGLVVRSSSKSYSETSEYGHQDCSESSVCEGSRPFKGRTVMLVNTQHLDNSQLTSVQSSIH